MQAQKNSYYIVSVSKDTDHVYYKTPCGEAILVATVQKMGKCLNDMLIKFTGQHTSVSMVARVGDLYSKLHPMHPTKG